MFNGLLPEKKFVFNKIELKGIERICKAFILDDKQNFVDYLNDYIKYCYNQEKIRWISIY